LLGVPPRYRSLDLTQTFIAARWQKQNAHPFDGAFVKRVKKYTFSTRKLINHCADFTAKPKISRW
jgi:hypothetical protein